MKLNKDFVLRQIAGSWVVIPLGSAALDFNSMIKLNETGAFLWQALEKGASKSMLVEALTNEYDVTEAQARDDVEGFLQVLLTIGCLVD